MHCVCVIGFLTAPSNKMTKFNTVTLDDLCASDTKITVKAPRKYDDAFMCKTFVGPNKVYIPLPRPVALSNCTRPSKGVIYIYFKMDSKMRSMILDLESKITDICKANVDEWFESRHKLNAESVEEFFNSNLVMDKRQKHMVFKTRLYTPDADVPYMELPLQTKYDVILRLVGIRFQKQSISLVWDIPSMIPVLTPHYANANAKQELEQEQELEEEQEEEFDSSSTTDDEQEIDLETVPIDPLVEASIIIHEEIKEFLDIKQKELDQVMYIVAQLNIMQSTTFSSLEEFESVKQDLSGLKELCSQSEAVV